MIDTLVVSDLLKLLQDCAPNAVVYRLGKPHQNTVELQPITTVRSDGERVILG